MSFKKIALIFFQLLFALTTCMESHEEKLAEKFRNQSHNARTSSSF